MYAYMHPRLDQLTTTTGFLPPIIFNSGYTLRRKVFMYYFVPIVLYAVVGTFLSSVVVGLALFGLSQVKRTGRPHRPPRD